MIMEPIRSMTEPAEALVKEFNNEFEGRDSAGASGHLCFWKSCKQSFTRLTELRTHVNVDHLQAPTKPTVADEDYCTQQGYSDNFSSVIKKTFIETEPSVEQKTKFNLRIKTKLPSKEIRTQSPQTLQCDQDKQYEEHYCFPKVRQPSKKQKHEKKARYSDSEVEEAFQEYPCPICKQNFETDWHLKCHIRKKHSVVCCKTCGITVPSYNILRHHRESHRCINEAAPAAEHLSHHSQYCPDNEGECDDDTSDSHIFNGFEEKKRKMTAHAPFGTLPSLILRDIRGFMAQCQVCSKIFVSKAALNSHMDMVHDILSLEGDVLSLEDDVSILARVVLEAGTSASNKRKDDYVHKVKSFWDDESRMGNCSYCLNQARDDSFNIVREDTEGSHASLLEIGNGLSCNERSARAYECKICFEFSFETWRKLELHMEKCRSTSKLSPVQQKKRKREKNLVLHRYKCLFCTNAYCQNLRTMIQHHLMYHKNNLIAGAFSTKKKMYVCLLCPSGRVLTLQSTAANLLYPLGKQKLAFCRTILSLKNHIQNFHKTSSDQAS